jgi:hypothetical protein
MTELSFDYWNKLAGQLIVISSLLGGFSLSVIIPLIESKFENSTTPYIFRAILISTACFLISIFAMTKILMITTPGFPRKVTGEDFFLPRIVGATSFIIGILSIIAVLFLSGWNKSGSLKQFSIILATLTLVLILWMLI